MVESGSSLSAALGVQCRCEAVTAEAIAPGDVFAGKYRFERLLGEGGQGWVWQARNLLLDVPVAIKVVRTEGADKTLPDRLFREARAAARLGHPAIVRVFDLGQAENGAPFLVMELLEGESLADKLVQVGRLPPELCLRLLLPIAEALLAAHAKGIVHRDVKPDNVFLALVGDTLQPKLLDFGIAKMDWTVSRDRQITQAGAVVGSPAYLSPEQARGLQEIDERADVWSFCATLYECLTGELPFEGATWLTLRQRILDEDPAPIVSREIADARLWQILRRGLAKNKQERWPSMLELGRALSGWLLDRGVKADVCGVSLEARWLCREPLAADLSLASLHGQADSKTGSPMAPEWRSVPATLHAAVPTVTQTNSRLGKLAARVARLGSAVLQRAVERFRSRRPRKAYLGLVSVVLMALLGIAFAKGRDGPQAAAMEQRSEAGVLAAQPPVSARPEGVQEEPVVRPVDEAVDETDRKEALSKAVNSEPEPKLKPQRALSSAPKAARRAEAQELLNPY